MLASEQEESSRDAKKWFPVAVTVVADAGRLGRRGDLATLQFVFVADIVSTLVVTHRARRALQFARA